MGPHPTIDRRPYTWMTDARRVAGGRAVYDRIKTRCTCRSLGDDSVPHAAIIAATNPMNFLNLVSDRQLNGKRVMPVVVSLATAEATIPVHATIRKPVEQIASWK